MARPSPMRDGFRTMFQQPSVGVAEVIWRWTFGASFLFVAGAMFRSIFAELAGKQGANAANRQRTSDAGLESSATNSGGKLA